MALNLQFFKSLNIIVILTTLHLISAPTGIIRNADSFDVTKQQISTHAQRISILIEKIFQKLIAPEVLIEQYKEQFKDVSFIDTNRRDSVKNIAENINEVLKLKIKALKKSVKFAELKAKNYNWTKNLTDGSVEYIDSKLLKDDENNMKYSSHFKTKILENKTTVHIPVEIFKGNIDILNGLKWTTDLVEVFRQNHQQDPTLLWQYFGSQTGFVRTYPGKRWKCHGPVDLYDVRRRSWYTQGSSSPKDMLILIDTSGSVHGQALQLMKVSVKSLLDTLGDDDFVNIAHFAKNASFIGCFQTFVQANSHNKKQLIRDVDRLQANEMADFKAGLSFAFEAFENFRANRTNNEGAACNEVIMLLTDGGSDTAEKVFKEKNKDKRVRVFTYAIGPTASPTYAIRWMACISRGYFSQIPAMGAIRSKVQEYLVNLKALKESHSAQHIGWTLAEHPEKLGLVTTVTLPVYNRTKDKIANQTILGVMGTDVSVSQFMDKVWETREAFGPVSYAFAINSNGYVLFHPYQKSREISEYDDIPNVDLLDVEFETEKLTEFRKDMIDEVSGEMKMQDKPILSHSMRYLTEGDRMYYFHKIDVSDFTLAIVEPPYERKAPLLRDKFSAFQSLRKDGSHTLIPKWAYYRGYDTEEFGTGTIEDLVKFKQRKDVKWNDQLMNHLKLDSEVSHVWVDYCKLSSSKRTEFEVHYVFFTGSSGLTRVVPDSEYELFLGTDPRTQDYFQRTMDVDDYIVSPPYMSGGQRNVNLSTLTITTAIKLDKNNYKYKPAVVGLNMGVTDLKSKIMIDICDPTRNACYLLDDGAFIILTNQDKNNESHVGQFLGSVDSALMNTLIANDIYKSDMVYDLQAICIRQDKESSPASRIKALSFISEFLSFNWWSSQISWSYFKWTIYSWFLSWTSASETFSYEENSCSVNLKEQMKYNCLKEGVVYSWKNKRDQLNSDKYIKCNDDCRRRYRTEHIPQTNLLLVVAESTEVCDDCEFPLLKQKLEMSEGRNSCTATPRYRRRPPNCYFNASNEIQVECGAATFKPSLLFLLSTVVLTFMPSLVVINWNYL